MNDESRSKAEIVRELQELREKLSQSQRTYLAVESELAETKKIARQRLAEIDTIYENAGLGLCVLDKEMRYIRINEELAKMNGVPPADHLGKTVREVVRDLYDAAEPIFRKVMESGEPVHGLSLNGETAALPGVMRHWVEQWLPLKIPEDETTGVAVVVEEVTAREQAEEALRESEERFRQLAESIDEVFWIQSSADWNIIYVNPAYERIWGRSCEELYENSENWIEAIHPDDRERVSQAFFEGAAEGKFNEEYRIVPPDGSIRWITDRGFPIRDRHRVWACGSCATVAA
jgi:PAS domain S-box-containing protein